MTESFHGVLPALITPFTEDGRAIDTDALGANVDRLIAAGVAGLVPGGSTGEFTTLTHAERTQLIETTIEAAGGRVPVVAGTGALSTRETAELSVSAERAGAAAVRIVPPFYDALSWRELLAHYTAVGESIDIPIMYYNLPSATGVKLTAAQFRELQQAGVDSLKDTGGDAVAATELIQTGGPTLLMGGTRSPSRRSPPGSERSYGVRRRSCPNSASTCIGCSSTTSICPPARRLWSRLWPLCHFLESRSYSAAVKAACRLVGDTTGPVRPPLLPLDDAATQELSVLLENVTRTQVASG